MPQRFLCTQKRKVFLKFQSLCKMAKIDGQLKKILKSLGILQNAYIQKMPVTYTYMHTQQKMQKLQ